MTRTSWFSTLRVRQLLDAAADGTLRYHHGTLTHRPLTGPISGGIPATTRDTHLVEDLLAVGCLHRTPTDTVTLATIWPPGGAW